MLNSLYKNISPAKQCATRTLLLSLLLLAIAPSTALAQVTLTPSPYATIRITQPGASALCTHENTRACSIHGSDFTNLTSFGDVTISAEITNSNLQFDRWTGRCGELAGGGTSFAVDPAVVNNANPLNCSVVVRLADVPRAYTQVSISNEPSIGTAQCALVENGTVQCWGAGGSGQLGNGSNENSATPVTVNNISTARKLVTGLGYACVLLANKTVWCWGSGGAGQLGNGSNANQNEPVKAKGLESAIDISAGQRNNYAILEGGVIMRWGSEGAISTTFSSNTPSTFTTITNATKIAAGRGLSCAILSDKSVRCWASDANTATIVGNGDGDKTLNTPHTVSNLTTAVDISIADRQICAVLENGGVQCWGLNTGRGLATVNEMRALTVPSDVVDINNAIEVNIQISVAVCVLLKDGTVQCSGTNTNGKTGVGRTTGTLTTPTTVLNISTAVALDHGQDDDSTCAVLVNGSIWCWGLNYGATPRLAFAGQPASIAPGGNAVAYRGAELVMVSPYRLANVTTSGVPSWLTYLDGSGIFFGTPPANATQTSITITPDATTGVPIDLSPTTISLTAAPPLTFSFTPSAITVADSAAVNNSVSAGLAAGTVVGTIRLTAQDNDRDIPGVTWSLTSANENFAINPITGTITTKKRLTASTTPLTLTARARLATADIRALQPDIEGLPDVTLQSELALSITVTAASDPINLHIKTYLEGPLQ